MLTSGRKRYTIKAPMTKGSSTSFKYTSMKPIARMPSIISGTAMM
jgi:hypothetical protein